MAIAFSINIGLAMTRLEMIGFAGSQYPPESSLRGQCHYRNQQPIGPKQSSNAMSYQLAILAIVSAQVRAVGDAMCLRAYYCFDCKLVSYQLAFYQVQLIFFTSNDSGVVKKIKNLSSVMGCAGFRADLSPIKEIATTQSQSFC